MKASDIYGGNSLKASDLGNAQPIVTIDKVEMKSFENGKKAVISFKGKDKTLICNVTNWNSIVDITGEEDSDNWAGHKVRLYVTKVDYQGKRVPAIRVDYPNGKPEPVQTPTEDEVPF